MYVTKIALGGYEKDTGASVVVPAGARLSDVYQAGRGPCLDLDWKPTRFIALAHFDGKRASVALDKNDMIFAADQL